MGELVLLSRGGKSVETVRNRYINAEGVERRRIYECILKIAIAARSRRDAYTTMFDIADKFESVAR